MKAENILDLMTRANLYFVFGTNLC